MEDPKTVKHCDRCELLVLGDDDHHADPEQHCHHLHHGLLERGALQQLGDNRHGGDVDEAPGCKGKGQTCSGLRCST